MLGSTLLLLPFLTLGSPESLCALPPETARWGWDGHQMAARAALEALPDEIPAFFHRAADQLIWLNPEPDRWRDQDFPELDQAFRYDHYIDLENIPGDGSLLDESRDRWEFHQKLLAAGVEEPQVRVGFLPFAILELQQRMVNGFARWRSAGDPVERRFLEARIIDDAGILGHFVTDGSQPHHTTIHFNGWDEEQVANPGGYTTDRGFHARFESRFVSAHVEQAHVSGRIAHAPRALEDVRGEVLRHIRQVNAHVEELYRIDRDHGFEPHEPPHPASLEFAADRIADGAIMLRDLWWSSWIQSEAVAAR